MSCFNCGSRPMESNKAFYPLEPKGTPNRKWICEDCIPEDKIAEIPQDVKDLVNLIKG